MTSGCFDVVTGAFGYTGKYITRLLLGLGKRVRTLTGHLNRPDPFGGRVQVQGYNFDRPHELRRSLAGCDTLYCTYWIRFAHGALTFDKAVENTRTLIQAAREAGVRRFAYVSITSADEHSPLPYFRSKGALERAIRESGMSYALIRPTVIFGPEDILINNLAWCLRRFPLFAIPGSGPYRLQPIFVEDLARITVDAGHRDENLTCDAVGPEMVSFDELVRTIAAQIGSKSWIVHWPPWLACAVSRCIGFFVGDVIVTRDEIDGLMAELLVSKDPPTGTTRLSDWLEQNAATVGTAYASELARHFLLAP